MGDLYALDFPDVPFSEPPSCEEVACTTGLILLGQLCGTLTDSRAELEAHAIPLINGHYPT